MNNIVYRTKINGNRVEILKKYRTKTQYEYLLTIFIGGSDIESILNYQNLHLTLKSAQKEAERAIKKSNKPRIERVVFDR